MACALALVLAPGPARAHLTFSPLDTSRYVKLEISAAEVRLVYSVGPGERPAFALLRGADTDRNGVVSEAEGKAFLDGEASRVAAGLALAMDGAPLRAAFAERNLGLSDRRVVPQTFAIDLVEHVAIPAGAAEGAPHRITLDDTTAYPGPGQVEVRVEEAPDVELLGTTVAGRPTDSPRSVTFATAVATGERRDVVVEFRVRAGAGAGAGGAGARHWRPLGLNPVALGVAALFAAVVGALAWRRERAREVPR
ncbi:MAG TPA: hypothetical protein VG389_15450 [Myxococcota bacterium]|nr:hypothetical protein [Myxococcota bacterium]